MISQEEIDVMMDMENEPIGITPEMMGAVVKGGEWHEEDSTTDKFIVAGRSYNQGFDAISEVLEQMKKDPLAEDIEACMQGMPSDEIARLFAEG